MHEEETTSQKKTAIEEADARIESLTASIDKAGRRLSSLSVHAAFACSWQASSDVDQLTTEIAELDNIIASTSAAGVSWEVQSLICK